MLQTRIGLACLARVWRAPYLKSLFILTFYAHTNFPQLSGIRYCRSSVARRALPIKPLPVCLPVRNSYRHVFKFLKNVLDLDRCCSSIHGQYVPTDALDDYNYVKRRQSRAGLMAESPSQATFFMPSSSAMIMAAFSPITSAVE